MTGIRHHRSHQCFKVIAGALEIRGTHQLKPPSREDADGVPLLAIRSIRVALHYQASGRLFIAVNGFEHGCSGSGIQEEGAKSIDATGACYQGQSADQSVVSWCIGGRIQQSQHGTAPKIHPLLDEIPRRSRRSSQRCWVSCSAHGWTAADAASGKACRPWRRPGRSAIPHRWDPADPVG